MNKGNNMLLLGFLNHAIIVSERFIEKVETGRARSVETYKDLKEIKEEAEFLIKRFDKLGKG